MAPDLQRYFSRDALRARLMEHLPDTTREPRRPMDKRLVQGQDTSVVQDHWMSEEVKQNLIAARSINDKQAKEAEKLSSYHEYLKKVHSALDHQCRELAATREMLRHAILQIHNQSKVKFMSISQSCKNDCEKTEAHIQEHEQGIGSTSSHKPKPEYAKRGPQTGARTNPTITGSVTTDQSHKEVPRCLESESRVVKDSKSRMWACIRRSAWQARRQTRQQESQ